MTNKTMTFRLLPILFTFFIMGFCDVVGISATHVKEDFGLSDTMGNMIPVVLFSMFLFFSIPTSMLMKKVGRKNTVIMSNALTVVALIIPLTSYSYVSMLCGFALLGIANTMLQVSLNPLLSNVVQPGRLASSLTAGQFIKAVSSFSAPFIAAFAARSLGHWEYIFPIFAAITLISTVWLMAVPIPVESEKGESTSFGKVFALLGDGKILLLFFGILAVVGVDVGMNTVSPKLLLERVAGMDVDRSGYGPSCYFAFRTAGAFIGAFLLARFSNSRFFRINIAVAIISIAGLIFIRQEYALYAIYAVVGFTVATVFSIIFSAALRHRPDKANEISGLMITGVFGGAVVSFLMGLASDAVGAQTGGVAVILICALFLLYCAQSMCRWGK